MNDEERINEEIRQFLNINPYIKPTYRKIENVETVKGGNIAELLMVLKELNRSHENTQGDSNKIDNSMLNAKMINLVRNILNERKQKEEEIHNKNICINELEKKIECIENKHQNEKKTFKYDSIKNNELNRIIKDQIEKIKTMKLRLKDEKQNCIKIKQTSEELALVNEELVKKAEIQNEQLSLFNEYVNNKNSETKKITKMVEEYQKNIAKLKENSEETLKKHEKLQSDLSQKKEIITNLNEKFAELVRKNEVNEISNKDMEERVKYYENIYKSACQQNDFLNEKLSNMINHKNMDAIKSEFNANTQVLKDEELEPENINTSFNTPMNNHTDQNHELIDKLSDLQLTHKKKRLYFKRKLNAHIEKIKEKEKTNKRLNTDIKEKGSIIEEFEKKIGEFRGQIDNLNGYYKDLTEKLFKKIENLTEENRERQEMIYNLKIKNVEGKNLSEKNNTRQNEYNDNKYENIHDNNDIRHNYLYDKDKEFEITHDKYAYDNDKNFNFLRRNEQKDDLFDFYANDNEDSFKTAVEKKSINERVIINEKPNLEEENYKDEIKQAHEYIKNNDVYRFLMNKDEKLSKTDDKDNIVENDPSKAFLYETDLDSSTFFIHENKDLFDHGQNDPNLSTTSSMRHMQARTDNLGKELNNLEQKLVNIKNNLHGNYSEKIKDGVKNNDEYFFSDINDFHNNPNVF